MRGMGLRECAIFSSVSRHTPVCHTPQPSGKGGIRYDEEDGYSTSRYHHGAEEPDIVIDSSTS